MTKATLGKWCPRYQSHSRRGSSPFSLVYVFRRHNIADQVLTFCVMTLGGVPQPTEEGLGGAHSAPPIDESPRVPLTWKVFWI